MTSLCIFLNTHIENSGTLAWLSGKGLAPFRYLFNGKTIRVQQSDSNKIIGIHHVASFHTEGSWNHSATAWSLKSSSKGMSKTALAIVFLIPGLILGAAFKGLAYLHSDVREKHNLAKEHLTPINREIGSFDEPIKTFKELERMLKSEYESDTKNRPTSALIIHADGDLKINEDPGFLQFNPMKLILEGADIIHAPSYLGRLDDAIRATYKWNVSVVRRVGSADFNAGQVKSIAEALQDTAARRKWNSCKRYHKLYVIPRAS